MKFPWTFPSRTITAVEMAFNAIFCAVPAFIRVDPVSASGPVSNTMADSAASASERAGNARNREGSMRRAHRAASMARTTKAAPPLAEIPTTASSALPTPRSAPHRPRRRPRRPRPNSPVAAAPPAMMRAHELGRRSERRRHLGGVEHCDASAAARADVVQRSAAREPRRNCIDRFRNRSACAKRPPTASRCSATSSSTSAGVLKRSRPALRGFACSVGASSLTPRRAFARDFAQATLESSYGAIAPSETGRAAPVAAGTFAARPRSVS